MGFKRLALFLLLVSFLVPGCAVDSCDDELGAYFRQVDTFLTTWRASSGAMERPTESATAMQAAQFYRSLQGDFEKMK